MLSNPKNGISSHYELKETSMNQITVPRTERNYYLVTASPTGYLYYQVREISVKQ